MPQGRVCLVVPNRAFFLTLETIFCVYMRAFLRGAFHSACSPPDHRKSSPLPRQVCPFLPCSVIRGRLTKHSALPFCRGEYPASARLVLLEPFHTTFGFRSCSPPPWIQVALISDHRFPVVPAASWHRRCAPLTRRGFLNMYPGWFKSNETRIRCRP